MKKLLSILGLSLFILSASAFASTNNDNSNNSQKVIKKGHKKGDFKNLTPEQQQKIKEKREALKKLTPEQREQLRAQREQKMKNNN